jgi:hypothetical protein
MVERLSLEYMLVLGTKPIFRALLGWRRTMRKIVASDKKCCFTLLETVDLDFAMVSAGIVVTAPGRIAGLVG